MKTVLTYGANFTLSSADLAGQLTNQAVVGYMINSHTIEKSSLVSYYKR